MLACALQRARSPTRPRRVRTGLAATGAARFPNSRAAPETAPASRGPGRSGSRSSEDSGPSGTPSGSESSGSGRDGSSDTTAVAPASTDGHVGGDSSTGTGTGSTSTGSGRDGSSGGPADGGSTDGSGSTATSGSDGGGGVKKARIRGMVVKRLAHAVRVASGHNVLTIHTTRRALASRHDGPERGDMGEFEIEFEHGDLVEDGFTPATPSGTVEIEGRLVSVSPLVVSIEGLPIQITVPSGITLPALTPGQEVELVVQTGANNTFTLVSIQAGDIENENEIEAKGPVTDSTTSQITIDAGGAMIAFAAPAGETLPVIATGTFVEARGVTINGVLTLTRLRTEDCNGGGGGDGGSSPDGGGCGH